MREIEQILELWDQSQRAGDTAVLATVVSTQGSSYRLPGARLLLLKDGRRAGSISGGCLEGDLLTKAWWLTENGPAVRRYDTNADGEIGTGGFGLGCNGITHVLLERLVPSRSSEESGRILQLLAKVRALRTPAAVCHEIGPVPFALDRLIAYNDGTAVAHGTFSNSMHATLERLGQEALATGVSRTETVEGRHFFCELLTPPIRLLIFGAGDDAIPLTEAASFLGWQTCVYDGRLQYARPQRFPNAQQVAVRPLGARDVAPPIDPWTAAVLMTHSYSQDLDILRELASAEKPPYLGVLGPRKRTAQLLLDAGVAPGFFGEALYSPLGLDIGADGPQQIALAVTAEIQAFFNRRSGGSLKHRAGSIHAAETAGSAESNVPPEEDTPFVVRPTACA